MKKTPKKPTVPKRGRGRPRKNGGGRIFTAAHLPPALDETYNPPRADYAKAGDPPGDRFKSHFATCKQKGEI